MKNSPENVLQKMYTGQKRSWFHNCGFTHANTIDMTHVIPDAVIPLTGNTTIKIKPVHYLQTSGTPAPLYEGMRVDVNYFFVPQRLYTRGMYGNNIVETLTLEQLPLPSDIIVSDDYDYEINGIFSSEFPAVVRGSLLNRLGFAPVAVACNGTIPLTPKNLIFNQTLSDCNSLFNYSNTLRINMAVVAGYYDICRLFYSNLFEDSLPIQDVTFNLHSDPSYSMLTANKSETNAFYSLADFGRWINDIRGVMNVEGDSVPRSYQDAFATMPCKLFDTIKFSPVDTEDGEVGEQDFVDYITVSHLASSLYGEFSSTGLWPLRYDSHWQTMFFQPEDINGLVESINLGANVASYRLAEAKYATLLKSILKGRTTEDWMDAQFTSRLKINDKPIKVGKDSFYVTYQQIVSTAQGDALQLGGRLGDTVSRGVGGNKSAYDGTENGVKPILFTTQEPGYLFVMVTCTPKVSYSNVTERFHEYDTLADFPLPSYGGKLFQDLKVSDFVFSGVAEFDGSVVGKQPYAFDHMTSFNRASGTFSSLEDKSIFLREFDIRDMGGDADWINDVTMRYMRSVYVEPNTFDNNFYDAGINGRNNFKLISTYNISKCMPFERQVTDYNI